jgi:hypothetical protein
MVLHRLPERKRGAGFRGRPSAGLICLCPYFFSVMIAVTGLAKLGWFTNTM